MWSSNPTWGPPRIQAELHKLGIDVSDATVQRYRPAGQRPPYETWPRFLLHDRDSIFGSGFARRVKAMGIEEVATAPGPPWQNQYCGRLIGSIRRKCLDHFIVRNERHLLRVVDSYASY